MSHNVAIINGKKPAAGVGGVSDADLSNVANNLFSPGVITETDYEVDQQSSPNMTLKVEPGGCYIPNAAGTNTYLSTLSAVQNVTIGNNTSGNPRIDAVVIKIDLGATPDNYGGNVATLVVVPGTAAGSPVAPTDSAIQTAVGAGNPFMRLANVAVANGAGNIQTANITDTRVWASVKTLSQPNVVADTYASTIKINLAKSPTHVITLTGNSTLSIINARVGQYFSIEVISNGNSLSWFSTINWVGGIAPPLTVTASKKDTFVFRCTSAGHYDGYISGMGLSI